MAPGMLNGIQIAERLAARQGLNPDNARSITNRVLVETFRGQNLTNYASDSVSYHREVLAFLEKCKQHGISPEVALAFASAKINMHQRRARVWQDCTGGQIPDFLVASNTSEVQTHHVFCDGVVEVDNSKKMHGTFGLCINVRNEKHLEHIDDFVPFAYSLRSNSTPAAIIFFGAWLPEPSSSTDVSGMTLQDHAKMANLRKEIYIRKATGAKHFIQDDTYHHFSGKGKVIEIPILSAVYDGSSGQVSFVNPDGTIGNPLTDLIPRRSYVSKDPRMAKLVGYLTKFAQDKAYPQIMRHSRAIKEVGCVDLRVNRTWDVGGLIKEIGSALPRRKIIRILISQLSSAALIGSHTKCGYIHTFTYVHNMNKLLLSVLGDKSSHLRTMVDQTYSRLSDRVCGAVFEKRALRHALEDPAIHSRMHRLGPENEKNLSTFLFDLISAEASDTRATINHGLTRKVLNSGKGNIFSMKAAAEVEEAVGELAGGGISDAHFQILVTEAHARNMLAQFEEVAAEPAIVQKMAEARNGNPEFDLTALVLDLKSGDKFLPQPHTPQTKDELFDASRKLFYNGQSVRVPSLAESIMR